MTPMEAANKADEMLSEVTAKMSPEQYKETIEELQATLEGRIDALRDEQPQLFD